MKFERTLLNNKMADAVIVSKSQVMSILTLGHRSIATHIYFLPAATCRHVPGHIESLQLYLCIP